MDVGKLLPHPWWRCNCTYISCFTAISRWGMCHPGTSLKPAHSTWKSPPTKPLCSCASQNQHTGNPVAFSSVLSFLSGFWREDPGSKGRNCWHSVFLTLYFQVSSSQSFSWGPNKTFLLFFFLPITLTLDSVISLEVLASPAERAEVPQVSLGTHTTGGSCRSRGGSNASDHPLLCCGLCPLHCRLQVFCQMMEVPGGRDG